MSNVDTGQSKAGAASAVSAAGARLITPEDGWHELGRTWSVFGPWALRQSVGARKGLRTIMRKR